MSEHIIKAYDDELDVLDKKVAEMGGLAEKIFSDAMESLSNFDSRLAQATVHADFRLDALQREIEERAIVTIARRQPLAVDLREIISTIRMANDLERVGDLAKNIAKRVIYFSPNLRMPRCVVGLRSMHRVAANLLNDALNAYLRRDADLALRAWAGDVELDDLHDSVFRDLLTFMMEDPGNISFCAHLLFCAKNVERVGDHATNIAETAIYRITGEAPPIDRPKGRNPTMVSPETAGEANQRRFGRP
ncbi:phosphate signaling complex protein PhoU [Methylocapsa acidiphila]|uniref:phosphate signaling complex protein PhoU n=1 Tax=Methylocapsa acidiphila TaxID=133552 RepID=UPI00041BD2AD|nr:phosphate signaling complex protein PhoU [Methylocapsa acidiphila]